MPTQLLSRLTAQDRALRLRYAIPPTASRRSRIPWTLITHLGDAGPVLLFATIPLLACCTLHQAAKLAATTLLVSHLIVQIIKRTVVRGRPALVEGYLSLVKEPDRFSFPSGHATASLSIALGYGAAFPLWSGPLVVLALLVGLSRVRLGVHYPSDVLIGQLIAVVTYSGLAILL
jgi:undecaprenyl-diphosphatase